MKKLSVIPLAVVFALAGCAADSQTNTAEPTQSATDTDVPTQSPSEKSTSTELNELKDRLSEAGFDCTNWRTTENVFSYSTASGACGSSTHLGSFDSTEDVDSEVKAKHKLAEDKDLGKLTWVVGDTWIISTQDADKVQDKLGGEVVKF